MKLNIYILVVIILLAIYHNKIQNEIEKQFFAAYFDYDLIKRPNFRCNKKSDSTKKCLGMPSGHTEVFSLIFFILYFNKIIPLWFCLLVIIIVLLQRIIKNKHTIIQTIVGVLFGYIYALIYNYFNLSIIGFIFVLFIGIILRFLTLIKDSTI